MDETVKDRLSQFCEAEKITKREFERRIGAANGFISSISKGIGVEKMKAIREKFPNINPTWLLYGEGDMYLQDVTGKGNNIANIETNSGTVNQGAAREEGSASEEKKLYQKLVELLEEKIKKLEDERSAFLKRHNCKSIEEIEDLFRDLKSASSASTK